VPQNILLVGKDGRAVRVSEEGNLGVDIQVTANVTDSKIKGSPDSGLTWIPFKTDADGNVFMKLPEGYALPVSLDGSINAYDPISGLSKSLSAAKDSDGQYVLRTVDAAPWAYDAEIGAIKVQPKKLVEIVRLINDYQVRDTLKHSSGDYDINPEELLRYIDLSKYKAVTFFAYDSTDAIINIRLNCTPNCGASDKIYYNNGSGWASIEAKTPDTQYNCWLALSSYPGWDIFNGTPPFEKIWVEIQAATVPTVGGISVWAKGVIA
jgi:hypothetical protein